MWAGVLKFDPHWIKFVGPESMDKEDITVGPAILTELHPWKAIHKSIKLNILKP